MSQVSISCVGPAELPEEGLPPPNDIDAEGVILSYIFEHGMTERTAKLESRHFYADANRRVFDAMQLVSSRGEFPDILAVARELRALNRLQQVGGSSYLATLCHAQPATAYPEQHVEAIREMYRRRVLGDVALEVRVKLRAGELRAAEAWDYFRKRCQEVNEGNE